MIVGWIDAFFAIEVTPRRPDPEPEDVDEPVIPPPRTPRILTDAGLAQGRRPFTGSSQPIIRKLYKHSPRRRRRY